MRGVLLVVYCEGPVGAHVTLDRRDGAVNVGDGLALGGLADQNLAIFGEGHHGWGGAKAFCVSYNGGFSTFEHANRAVGGAKVDAYCTCHVYFLFLFGLSARFFAVLPRNLSVVDSSLRRDFRFVKYLEQNLSHSHSTLRIGLIC